MVLALLVGRRLDYQPGSGGAVLPHNLPMTLLGAGLLWFGWFGFNAGSAVGVVTPVAGAIGGSASLVCYLAVQLKARFGYDDPMDAFGGYVDTGMPDSPANPNGASRDIAAISNREGNIVGMMPHPERLADPLLGSDAGARVFRSLVRWKRPMVVHV